MPLGTAVPLYEIDESTTVFQVDPPIPANRAAMPSETEKNGHPWLLLSTRTVRGQVRTQAQESGPEGQMTLGMSRILLDEPTDSTEAVLELLGYAIDDGAELEDLVLCESCAFRAGDERFRRCPQCLELCRDCRDDLVVDHELCQGCLDEAETCEDCERKEYDCRC